MPLLNLRALQPSGQSAVTLELNAGECLGLAGDSGAGKTRLLRAIADMDPHGGEAFLDGVAASAMPAPAWRRRVALLPAESAWWFDSVGEHFGQGGMARLHERIEALGLDTDILQRQAAHCSSGEKQRLALLRLLQNDPDILLLDEPTANLDAASRTRVENLIGAYLKTRPAAALWVTHDSAQLQRMADRRFLMRAGQLEPAA